MKPEDILEKMTNLDDDSFLSESASSYAPFVIPFIVKGIFGNGAS